jgi:hypothetical protein
VGPAQRKCKIKWSISVFKKKKKKLYSMAGPNTQQAKPKKQANLIAQKSH